jgi:hypothetical protein
MGDPNTQPLRVPSDFRDTFGQSRFISGCGYDRRSSVLDVPLRAVRSLSEGLNRAMMHLRHRRAERMAEKLNDQITELERADAEDHFAGLVSLSDGFPA